MTPTPNADTIICSARVALGVAAIIFVLLCVYRTSLVCGKDNRFSTSKTAALLWTLFVLAVLATMTVFAFRGSADEFTKYAEALSQAPADDYLLLLGGPFAALVGAKGIVATRVSSGAIEKTLSSATGTISVADLTSLVTDDEGNADLVDVQFFLFNLLALVWAAVAFTRAPTEGLPPIPAGLAGLTSVSALAYLGNKAIERTTPRISHLSPRPVRRGERLTIEGQNLLPAGATNTDVTVLIGGLLVEVDTATSGELKLRVPEDVGVSSSVDVSVNVSPGAATSAATTTAQIAVIEDGFTVSGLTPNSAGAGRPVTIQGRRLLGPDGGTKPTVTVGGVGATLDPGWTNESVTFRVPALAEGEYEVVVDRDGLSPGKLKLQVATPAN